MSEAIKYANTSNNICYMIDTLDPVVQGVFHENYPIDALEQSLTHGRSCGMDKEEIRKQVAYLDAPWKKIHKPKIPRQKKKKFKTIESKELQEKTQFSQNS